MPSVLFERVEILLIAFVEADELGSMVNVFSVGKG